jgi:hypothetical protein
VILCAVHKVGGTADIVRQTASNNKARLSKNGKHHGYTTQGQQPPS